MLKEAAKGCATLDTFIVRKVCTQSMNCGSVLISGMKRQRSPSPIDLDIEEIFPEARVAEIRARDDPLPPSANSPSMPRPEEAPAQSMADLAKPYQIDDTEAVLARSAANLPTPNPDASTKDADRVLTRSAAKLAMAR